MNGLSAKFESALVAVDRRSLYSQRLTQGRVNARQ